MSNINFKEGWLKEPKYGEKFAPKTTTNQVLTGDGERLTDELANIKADVSTRYETTVKAIDELGETVSETFKKLSYQFNTEDFTVTKEGADTSTHISENGMCIKDSDKKDVLKVDSSGVDAKNLHANTYLIIGNNSRLEDYGENRTGVFWIGGN